MTRPDADTAKAIIAALDDDERAMLNKIRDGIKSRNRHAKVSLTDALEIVLELKSITEMRRNDHAGPDTD